jgi:hypothetical protein
MGACALTICREWRRPEAEALGRAGALDRRSARLVGGAGFVGATEPSGLDDLLERVGVRWLP